MLDNITCTYPDLNSIIKTCKRTITKDEEDLCIKSFPRLFNIMDKRGHIPDKVFEVSITTTSSPRGAFLFLPSRYGLRQPNRSLHRRNIPREPTARKDSQQRSSI